MVKNDQEQSIFRLAGYAALIERYDLNVIPNWHRSLVTARGIHRIDSDGGVIEEVYPSKYWPGDTLGGQLEFALKYDGTNLGILASLFQKAVEEDFHRQSNRFHGTGPGVKQPRPAPPVVAASPDRDSANE